MSRIFKASDVVVTDSKVDIVSESRIEPPRFYENEDVELELYHIIDTAKKEAQSIIIRANSEAQKLILEAQRTAESEVYQINQIAKEDGFEAGYKYGMNFVEEIKTEQKAIRNEIIKTRESLLNDLEKEIVQLVIDISEKLIGKMTIIRPEIILNLVKQGLNSTTLSGNISIRVSVDDYELVISNKDNILSAVDNSLKLEIIKDISIKRFDCIIETDFGNVYCGLDEQFEFLKESIFLLLGDR